MSDDKIEEIRARHLREDRWRYSPSPQMHDDRATLLAEVDRQRAEIERLQAENERLHNVHESACEGGERLHKENIHLRLEIERLLEALEGKP